MHEKCITPFVVTQILSYLDKHAKKEPAFLPKIKIKTHAYPKYNIENLCDTHTISQKFIVVKKKYTEFVPFCDIGNLTDHTRGRRNYSERTN